jgi:uncharacterized protein YjbJ (UPF0337 family)
VVQATTRVASETDELRQGEGTRIFRREPADRPSVVLPATSPSPLVPWSQDKLSNEVMFPSLKLGNTWAVGERPPDRGYEMSGTEDRTEGTIDKAKGKAKETVGDVTGNERLEREGKRDQAKGAAEKVKGHVKDAADDVRDGVDDLTK